MSVSYIPATFSSTAFNCPLCNVYAKQAWPNVYYQSGGFQNITNLKISICTHCQKYCIWHDEFLLYPSNGTVPVANPDLPEIVQGYYNEAKSVINLSPRSAAALLRLGIEELFKHLINSGKSINHDIKQLVKNGLSPQLQQALDVLRVVGNHAAHAGQIEFSDDSRIANQLFPVLNFIAEEMITKPRQMSELYASLPTSDLETIQKRDNPNPQ